MTLRAPEVWFVDDDEDDRLTVRMAFDEIDPRISLLTLNNGSQLLAELAEEAVPRLLLLDLNMPELTGLELLRQLRDTTALSTLPIIILTTSNSVIDREQCFAAGATDFITKPSSYQQLTALARQLNQRWLAGANSPSD